MGQGEESGQQKFERASLFASPLSLSVGLPSDLTGCTMYTYTHITHTAPASRGLSCSGPMDSVESMGQDFQIPDPRSQIPDQVIVSVQPNRFCFRVNLCQLFVPKKLRVASPFSHTRTGCRSLQRHYHPPLKQRLDAASLIFQRRVRTSARRRQCLNFNSTNPRVCKLVPLLTFQPPHPPSRPPPAHPSTD